MTEATVLLDASKFLNANIKSEWAAQGHHLSGEWEDSITTQMVTESEVEGLARAYGSIVNAGTTAARIPYGGTGTGAKTSAYIQGLYGYFKAKGCDHKDALSFAFATAKKQKKEGMSTAASKRFSSTGQRQHFLEEVIQSIGKQLDEIIFNGMDELININANQAATLTI